MASSARTAVAVMAGRFAPVFSRGRGNSYCFSEAVPQRIRARLPEQGGNPGSSVLVPSRRFNFSSAALSPPAGRRRPAPPPQGASDGEMDHLPGVG
ncbi:hypothetical protein [Streptomyces sp. NEAU-NA10]|uniref:hypothetical protein n=1 Tax=Streptomyces sp. NEAU-NA10 TaxID=3416050 RepID=UPI003CC65581